MKLYGHRRFLSIHYTLLGCCAEILTTAVCWAYCYCGYHWYYLLYSCTLSLCILFVCFLPNNVAFTPSKSLVICYSSLRTKFTSRNLFYLEEEFCFLCYWSKPWYILTYFINLVSLILEKFYFKNYFMSSKICLAHKNKCPSYQYFRSSV